MSDIFFDESFELEKTQEYKLSIQVSLDGFSFSIIHPTEQLLLAYNSFPLKISKEKFLARRFNDWVQSEKIFQNKFKIINIVFDTEKFTVIPEKYYDYNSKTKILDHLFELEGESDVEEITLEEINAKLLIVVPVKLKNEFTRHFEEFNLLHPIKILFDNLPLNDKKFKTILFFRERFFYSLLFKESKLLLSNSFSIIHENDCVYYILSVLKEMKVAKSAVDLYVTGKIDSDSNLFSDLQKYIVPVQFLKHKHPIRINENIFRESEKISFTLLS
jgi:hypothetical protein